MKRVWLVLSAAIGLACGEGAKVPRQLAAVPLLYGHFTQQKDIKGLKKPLVSGGDFLVAKDKGVIWRTQKPFVAAVAITGKGIWSLQDVKGGPPKRAPIHQGNLGATMGMIQKVLSGDPGSLGKSFAVESGGGDSAWTLRLAPKDSLLARFIKGISVKGGAHVDEVEYLEANGDKTRIAFSEVAESGGALDAWRSAALGD